MEEIAYVPASQNSPMGSVLDEWKYCQAFAFKPLKQTY